MPDFGGRGGDMRSAIKFLQDMDSYYGQIARPSFNKRWPRQKLMNYFNTRNRRSEGEECPENIVDCDNFMRFYWLQNADSAISRLNRPRFGKRGGNQDLGERYLNVARGYEQPQY